MKRFIVISDDNPNLPPVYYIGRNREEEVFACDPRWATGYKTESKARRAAEYLNSRFEYSFHEAIAYPVGA